MTQQQASEFERALARAHRAGLAIAGRGTWKHDGAAFVAVTSSRDAARVHLVTIRAGRLACDCEASQYHPERICSHRALAHEDLQRQLEARAAAVAAARETAPLYRDNRAFSLFKR